MRFLNKVVSFFLDEETVQAQKAKLQTIATSDTAKKSAAMLKNMFIKTDPFALTEFPYQWEKDFFPPLDDKERKYMKTEIMRWYSIYLEVNNNDLIETLVEGVTSSAERDHSCVYFNNEYPEEFRLMIQDILNEDFIAIANGKVQTYDGNKLIKWKPVQGDSSWEPPTNELLDSLTQLLGKIVTLAEENLKIQLEQEAKLREIKEQALSYSARAEAVSRLVISFLEKNRNEITKHAHDRTILELNSFPTYYGKYEKEFRNHLFAKYKDDFGVSTYNELIASAVVHLQPFIQANGKMELKRWYYYQWDEFVDFVRNEYLHLSEEELDAVQPSELNIYSLSIDFYALTMFKLHLDGM